MATQIRVVLSEKGLDVSPGQAEAKVGELITWEFKLQGVEFFPARFTIYFPDGTPFPWHMRHVEAANPNALKDTSIQVPPRSPGKYKYGVKVNRLDSGEGVEDIDPYLYVYD